MEQYLYVGGIFLIVLSNVYAFKIGRNSKTKEVESLKKHLKEAMQLVFKKQREINRLKGNDHMINTKRTSKH